MKYSLGIKMLVIAVQLQEKQVEPTETYTAATGRTVTKERIMYLKNEGDK